MQSITDEGFLETKYERVAEVARVMTEGEAVVLVVLNGKEGTGYAVHADSGLADHECLRSGGEKQSSR